MSGRATDPFEVPAHVWEHPEMAVALRKRDVGQIFKLVLKYTGYSQTRIGVACGMDQGAVSLYMNGKRQVVQLDKFEEIASGLGMPDTTRMALGLAPKRWEDRTSRSISTTADTVRPVIGSPTTGPTSDITVTSDSEGIMVPCCDADGRTVWVFVPRRTFLLGGIAAATAITRDQPVPSHTTLRIPTASDDSGNPIERLERIRQVLIESDNLLGPAQVFATVRDHIAIIQRMRAVAEGADRQALQAMQAKFAEFASWLCHDMADFHAAQHWTDRALAWSHRAGDQELTAYIYARKSQLAGDMRDSAGALDYGEAAMELAPPKTRLSVAAAVFAAHGHALEGRHGRDAALKQLDNAKTALGDLDNDPESTWAPWMNAAYLDVERARCLTLVGDHQEATEIFQRAIKGLPTGFHRDRGVYLAREALAHARARQIDQAAQVGTAALSIASETESGRIIFDLAHLGTELASWGNVAEVAEFHERLRSTLPQVSDRPAT